MHNSNNSALSKDTIFGAKNHTNINSVFGGLSVNLRFFRKSLNKLGNIVLFRDFCTEVFMG